MMLTPYQHGVVRVLKESLAFSESDPQFQNYKYVNQDLSELVAKQIIRYVPRTDTYVQGPNFEEVRLG